MKKRRVSSASKIANSTWEKAVLKSRRSGRKYKAISKKDVRLKKELKAPKKAILRRKFNKIDKNKNKSIDYNEFKNYHNR